MAKNLRSIEVKMDFKKLAEEQQKQINALSDLVLMSNKSVLDQRQILMKDMEKQIESIYPTKKPDKYPQQSDELVSLKKRLDKIELDLLELRRMQAVK